MDWLATASQIYNEPFGDGLPITLMLLSTFLPSCFNLGLSTILFLMRCWRGRYLSLERAANLSKDADDLRFSLALCAVTSFIFLVPFIVATRFLLFGTILFEGGIGSALYSVATYF